MASLVLAALLGVVSGVATNTLSWLGGWSWAGVAALVAAAAAIELRRGAAAEPAPPAAPDTVPRDVGDFTGREAELLELRELIRRGSRTLLISAIDGTPGVGKSTLQIHLAHSVVRRFPDARLYANLRGGEDIPEPVAPLVVLEQFLRSLGERRVPQRLDDAVSTYRRLLAGKRALILLDNASSVDQVRPLLPGSASCTVVVTSRTRLAGLEGAHGLTLAVFSDEEAHELLTRIVGADRVREDEESTARVVAYCGKLPLALRIAGSRLAHRPEWTMRTLAERLGDERERLAMLTAGDLSVRASFMISYRELEPAERALFRLAAAARTSDLATGAAASALGVDEQQAKPLLDRLVELHLLEPTAPDGVQFHDLLRLFAREMSAEEDTAAERDAALGRVMAWYLHRTADEPPSSWPESRQENVLALIEQAAEHGRDASGDELRPYCWKLAFALAPSLEERGDLATWQDSAQRAADAAARAGDRTAHALALADLGRLHEARGELPGAEELLHDAARRLRGGDRRARAQALTGLARVRRKRARPDSARGPAEEALTLHRSLPGAAGRPETLACLVELGDIESARGAHGRAVEHFQEALTASGAPLATDDEAPRGLFDPAAVHARLGDALRELKRFDAAGAAFEKAARRYAARGDEAAYATMLEQTGITHEAAERPREAVAAYDRCREVHRSLGRTADACRLDCNKAASLWRLGRAVEATELLRAAIRRAGDTGTLDVKARAEINLGEILLADGDTPHATRLFEQADASYRTLDDPAGQARALSSLARARTLAGDGQGAVDALRAARQRARGAPDATFGVSILIELALAQRDRGERNRAADLLTEAVQAARTLPEPQPALTAHALLHLGGLDAGNARIAEAVAHFQEARELFRECGDRAMEASALMYLGQVHREGPARPRYADSERAYEEAARLWRETGDRHGEGRATVGAAVTRAHLGDVRSAEHTLSRARSLLSGDDAALAARCHTLALRHAPLPQRLPW